MNFVRPRLLLNETFGPTIQGEGLYTGIPSYFIRTAGCSVRCAGCDTKKSWGASTRGGPHWRSVQTIQSTVLHSGVRHAVITGGEPLECRSPEALAMLVRELACLGISVTVETSGSIVADSAVMAELVRFVDLWSLSPKLSAMQPQRKCNPEFVAAVTTGALNHGHKVQLKFVMDPDNWARDFRDLHALLWDFAKQPVPVVPLIFQTYTRPGDTALEILDRTRRLFQRFMLEGSIDRFVDKWDFWSARFLPQLHVLVGVS